MFFIAIDFDGTIVEHAFPLIGEPVEGAFYWMKAWEKAGASLILWTCRNDRKGVGAEGPVLTQAVEFCLANGQAFYAVNDNPDQRGWSQSPKVYAHMIVDDNAFGCPLNYPASGGRPTVDWSIVGPRVLAKIMESKKR